MSARKASHGTIFLIVSSGSPLALIASSRRSTSKKPFCPMTRSLHPPATAGGQRVRFATTWRDEFFEVPIRPSVRDRDRDGMTIRLVGDLDFGTKGQRFVRRRHGVIVDSDAAGSFGSTLR